MDLFGSLVLIILGLVALTHSAYYLIEGAAAFAKKYKVSEVNLGLSLVAFGTSVPEISVNLASNFRDDHEVVFANTIGSNIFNLFVILGIVGLIHPIKMKMQTVWREIPYSILITIVLFVLLNDNLLFGAATNELGRIDSLILIGLCGLFIIYIFASIRKFEEKASEHLAQIDFVIHELTNRQIVIYIFSGLIILSFAGYVVVDQVIDVATYFGVSKKLIALVILAPGTSLPELITAIVATSKKRTDFAIGNVIGSNIFNILLSLSLCGITKPVFYDYSFNFEIVFLLFGSILLFICMFTGKESFLDRWETMIFLSFFCGYVYFIFIRL